MSVSVSLKYLRLRWRMYRAPGSRRMKTPLPSQAEEVKPWRKARNPPKSRPGNLMKNLFSVTLSTGEKSVTFKWLSV